MKNRFVSGIVSIALFLSPITAHANNHVTFDGKMLDNRVYLPTRKTGEQLVARVGPYVKILDGREFMFNFVN